MADSRLTHVDESGRVRMVDVSGKEVTDRFARARGEILMQADTVRLITGNRIAKGNVIETARLAGIMAAKRTADLIPLCHPLNLTAIDLEFEVVEDRVRVWAEARISARTGVEMEALTAVTAGLAYDLRHVQGGRPGDGAVGGRAGGKNGGESGATRRPLQARRPEPLGGLPGSTAPATDYAPLCRARPPAHCRRCGFGMAS